MVVLAGPTLQDASCDHTVIHINAGLDDSILYVAGPTWPGDCMLASIQKTGHVSRDCTHVQIKLFRTDAGLAVRPAKETAISLQKALYT